MAANLIPAADPTNPQTGSLVRLTFYPHATYRHYERFVEHRELEIVSIGTDSDGRHFVQAVSGAAKSTIFADASGRFPQFKLAASLNEPPDWRMGYYDALEFIPTDRRYIKPPEEYMSGYARGVEDRARFGLRQSFESIVLETDRPAAVTPSSKLIGTFDITFDGRNRKYRR